MIQNRKNSINIKGLTPRAGLFLLLAFGVAGCLKPKGTSACPASQTAATAGSEVGVMDPALGSGALAQSFTVPSLTTVLSVQLELSVIGSIDTAQTLTLNIVPDIGGSPDTNIISSGSLPIRNIIPGAPTFYAINLSSAQLRPGSRYWLVLSGSYAASSTNQVRWSSSNTSVNPYPNGSALYQDGTGWTNALLGPLQDFVFKIGSC